MEKKVNFSGREKVRMQQAYIKARQAQLVDIDLNRARIVFIDQQGHFVSLLQYSEH